MEFMETRNKVLSLFFHGSFTSEIILPDFIYSHMHFLYLNVKPEARHLSSPTAIWRSGTLCFRRGTFICVQKNSKMLCLYQAFPPASLKASQKTDFCCACQQKCLFFFVSLVKVLKTSAFMKKCLFAPAWSCTNKVEDEKMAGSWDLSLNPWMFTCPGQECFTEDVPP